jgi:hypothetical protein
MVAEPHVKPHDPHPVLLQRCAARPQFTAVAATTTPRHAAGDPARPVPCLIPIAGSAGLSRSWHAWI